MSWFLKLIELIRSWRKEKPDPKPEPDPDPLSDAIDWKEITWLGVNVGAWEKKYALKVSLKGNLIVYDQEGTSNWPAQTFGTSALRAMAELDIPLANMLSEDNAPQGTPLSGNPWVIAKLNGKWTAATHEWMRPGQKEKGKRSVHGDHIKRGEFGPNWVPTVGEEYGFCVSGLCRDAKRNAQERTQIVLYRWS